MIRIYILDYPNELERNVRAFDIDENMIVSDLKANILVIDNIESERYYLSTNGKILDESKSFATQNVDDNSFVWFKLRAR